MLFESKQLPAIIEGRVTRTYRLWQRPQVRVGRRYRLHQEGALEIDAMDIVKVRSISNRDARLSGFDDKAALVAKLAERGQVNDSTEVYRIDFHYVPLQDKRVSVAQASSMSEREVQQLSERLARMDETSKHGLWTHETLALIERRPRSPAAQLAERVGRETQSFEADVRKLKELGLTISHEVGYELSPRGQAYLKRIERRSSS
ncbi:MAG: hypothetical protein WD939_08660 [Dehalococcoidia bacterium]